MKVVTGFISDIDPEIIRAAAVVAALLARLLILGVYMAKRTAGSQDGCQQFYEQGLKAAYGFRENMSNELGDVYLKEALFWLAVHQSCAMERR